MVKVALVHRPAVMNGAVAAAVVEPVGGQDMSVPVLTAVAACSTLQVGRNAVLYSVALPYAQRATYAARLPH